ncbi:helix-turn-helix domain-containing protein [Massilia sp. CT11-108]|uniref:helix-turn-helix domain-containing protein n=1 Tax=Massilia sp. CT11-108 TaxID=3393900 RepID=UPI0039A5BE83
MQSFYNKALAGLLGLVVASVLIGYACVRSTWIRLPLLPAADSGLPWRAELMADSAVGGRSTARLIDDTATLSFEFTSVKAAAYPFVHAELAFRDRAGKFTHVDLSRYSAVEFDVNCAPANTLAFGLVMFDDQVSVPGQFDTYRAPYTYFFCNKKGEHVELDLARLRTDQWWFDRYGQNLARQEHTLTRIAKLSFGSTFQSPYGVLSKVQVRNLTLTGRDMRYLYLFAAFMVVAWPGYGLWFFRRHTQALLAEVKDKMRRDIPLVAYQQLSQDLHRDKEQSAILRFMATEYVKPELDVETTVNALGISRNKINEILKAELGFTFSTYLNKLRLTEAARLLGAKEDTSVAEIAYAVGYRNVSYFNKLFKEEYGCTPKTFRKLRDSAPESAGP